MSPCPNLNLIHYNKQYNLHNIQVAANAKELKLQSLQVLRQAFEASKQAGTVKKVIVEI
ncbi:hypothetical protein QDY72_08215 [Kingella negevensis]|uniref:hypothetical protein n=1 Tax=Kingella negevensis TaxID=1522312 RepID=UPI00254B691A|nr:hypothetical protein [Kingella negevensis]MDK4679334.1 hypothetical protein [Kingella negevensis]MDK4685157.1 hypothetical protein [Kingella negevensis]